jgi:RNA-directed DNA polymerase
MGFVLQKSIVDNAQIHVGNNYVLNMDLKDFFFSFDLYRVKFGLLHEIWGIQNISKYRQSNESEYEIKDQLAFLIACLCTHSFEVEGGLRRVLPQGSPASPTITNILCKKLDRRLSGLAKRFGINYSRYADDITFSSMHNIYASEDFNNELIRIIREDQKFIINEQKTRLQKKGFRQEATGLIINDKVNVRRRHVKNIRMWLYYWEKYGFHKASDIFQNQYALDKGHVKNSSSNFIKVLKGKLEFLKMVKGANDGTYLKLVIRFNKLLKSISPQDLVLVSNGLISNYDQLYVENSSNNSVVSITSWPLVHNPKRTVDLLMYFTANDKHLKYTTHSWEAGKYASFDDFYDKIKREWAAIGPDVMQQSSNLHAKIQSFLFNNKLGIKKKNGHYWNWGEKYLKFGWSSPVLRIHMENQESSPFSCVIPDEIRILDRQHKLLYFKDYADAFKNEIEFREDSKNLRNVILQVYHENLGLDFEIFGLEHLTGFSFFSDVAKVKAAVRVIFEMFGNSHYRQFSRIQIERESNLGKGAYHLVRITQLDSFIGRSINDPKLINPTGDLYKVIENLRSLADYSIISRFSKGECYRLNYLTSEKKPFFEEVEYSASGFTHEMKFYL